MKKLALAIALTGFIGTYSIASSFDAVNTEIGGEHDAKKCKDKNCKKCKDANASKKTCTATGTNTKSCNSNTTGKSCCSKK
ncbi:MAG: hypothetical protein KDC84_01830 [Crocinitomicaceae bacterium]|nr:hypothetical protein [Crocinitomicaceae bacterium]